MADDNKIESGNDNSALDTNADYIAAIKELKANSVNRSEYEKLRADNKRLLDAVVNGQTADEGAKKKPAVDIAELRNKVFNEDNTNLSYWENTLALRQALIDEGKPDPFLPYGEKIVPTNEDIEAADRVAKVVQECIDYAEGDTQAFTNELMRRTVDTGPRRK